MKGKLEPGYKNELFHAIVWGKVDDFEKLVEGGQTSALKMTTR